VRSVGRSAGGGGWGVLRRGKSEIVPKWLELTELAQLATPLGSAPLSGVTQAVL